MILQCPVAPVLAALSTRFVGQQPDRRQSHQRVISHQGDRDTHNKQARPLIPVPSAASMRAGPARG
ncbi:MAG: hypothetical protein JWM19_7858 [Actinomycetia bacterium]|nr:hypothetical protein [Actinomycetes bacterium]